VCDTKYTNKVLDGEHSCNKKVTSINKYKHPYIGLGKKKCRILSIDGDT